MLSKSEIEKKNFDEWNACKQMILEKAERVGLKIKFVHDAQGYKLAWIEEPENQHHTHAYSVEYALGIIQGYALAKNIKGEF